MEMQPVEPLSEKAAGSVPTPCACARSDPGTRSSCYSPRKPDTQILVCLCEWVSACLAVCLCIWPCDKSPTRPAVFTQRRLGLAPALPATLSATGACVENGWVRAANVTSAALAVSAHSFSRRRENNIVFLELFKMSKWGCRSGFSLGDASSIHFNTLWPDHTGGSLYWSGKVTHSKFPSKSCRLFLLSRKLEPFKPRTAQWNFILRLFNESIAKEAANTPPHHHPGEFHTINPLPRQTRGINSFAH